MGVLFGWPAVIKTDKGEIPIPFIDGQVDIDGAELLRRMKEANLKHDDGYGPRALYGCPVCGEGVPRYGATCDRCRASIEEDRLNRESGR